MTKKPMKNYDEFSKKEFIFENGLCFILTLFMDHSIHSSKDNVR